METTEESTSFIDDLLVEAEATEQKDALAYYDLVIAEITRLEADISEVNSNCNAEIELIRDWALNRSVGFQDRIDFLKLKLEAYIRKQEKKTIDLPHGVLKLRQSPDKVEVSDVDLFLANANKDMVTITPEQIKPSLTAIKKWMKMTTKIPEGVTVIGGKETFSLKLKEIQNDTKKEV